MPKKEIGRLNFKKVLITCLRKSTKKPILFTNLEKDNFFEPRNPTHQVSRLAILKKIELAIHKLALEKLLSHIEKSLER
jgi:hypothetical protein